MSYGVTIKCEQIFHWFKDVLNLLNDVLQLIESLLAFLHLIDRLHQWLIIVNYGFLWEGDIKVCMVQVVQDNGF
jgi:hypothetical protein